MKRILIVFVLALIIRLSYLGVALRDATYATPVIDSATYVEDALRVLEGKGFKDAPFWQGPLYPLFLALPFSAAPGSVAMAGFFQSVLGALGCLLTYNLAGKILSRTHAMAAALLQALYPLSVFFDVEILPVVLQVPLLVGSVSLLVTTRKERVPFWRPLASGLLMGLCSLAVPSSLLPAAVLGAWCLLSSRSWKDGARNGSLFLLGLFLALCPVSLRNKIQSSEWCLISSNGGINFYIGNAEKSLEYQSIRPGIEWQILMRTPLAEGNTTPMEKSSFFYRKAFEWLEEQPLDALQWTAAKLFLSLHSREIVRNRDFYEAVEKAPWLGVPPRPFALLFALALVGALRAVRRRDPPALLCAGMACAVILVGVLFFPTARYRAGALPFLFVLSVFAVKEAKAFLARSDWRGRLGLGLTFLAAATFSLLPHPFPSNRELNRSLYNEAHVMRLGGRHREAAQLLRLCIQQGVGGVDAWNELALCSVEMDRTSEAEWIWRYIARLEPEAFEAHYNLGVSLQEREGYAEALKSYASARALDPTMRPLLLRMAFCARKLGHVELANRFLAEAAAISLR